MAHSYTSLKQFDNCPRQYHEVRVLKKYPFVKTAESEFGDRAHKALELCGRDGIPLPDEFKNYQWVIDDIVRRLPGTVTYEHEFSLSASGSVVPHRAWNQKYWTGKADVLAINGDHAIVIDWKTGSSRYPDPDQLEMMGMFTLMQFPQINRVSGMLLFLQDGTAETAEVSRSTFSVISGKFYTSAKNIEFAQDSGKWPMNKTGLCPYCPVTDCPNWKPKPEKK